MSRDRAAVLHGLHTCHTLAVLLIHTRSKSLNLSNPDFGVMTLVLVLLQMSRNPWMAELSEAAVMVAVYVIGAVKEIRDGGGRLA